MKLKNVREEDLEAAVKRAVKDLEKFGLLTSYHIEDTDNGKRAYILVSIPSVINAIRRRVSHPLAKTTIEGDWLVIVVGG